jgi:hypothetical protein
MHLVSRHLISTRAFSLVLLLVVAASAAGFAQVPIEGGLGAASGPSPDGPERSEALKNSKDPDFILRNFRTMYVDARDAQYFGADLLKAELHRNDDFEKLNIHIVDNRAFADVVLVVSYTFAWDYPFELRHQNTTMVLLAGKGEGPFSGPLGAASVAGEFVELVKKYRTAKDAKK